MSVCAGQVEIFLEVFVPSHIWYLLGVCSCQVWGLLVSFCWSHVCLVCLFSSRWKLALGSVFWSGKRTIGAVSDGEVRGLP